MMPDIRTLKPRELESSVSTFHELLEAMERTVIEQSARLQEALAIAQRASHAKSDFLSTISHEIRSPMNALLGMGDLLAETRLDPEQRDYLDIIMASGNSLMDIVNSMLDLARIESGRLQLEHSQFDLTDLIDRTVSTFAVQAHRKGLELVARIAPTVPDYLVGDPQRLRQIIVNLFSNAIKFTDSGGVVLEVEAAPRSSALVDVRFSLTDSGIGIATSHLDSILSSFVHGSSSAGRQSGSGPGLLIAKCLVDLMRGQICVESALGKGSKFSFTAPFGLPCSALAPVASITPDLLGTRVLVVDDHRINRLLVQETMAQCRAEVSHAASGDEALTAIRRAVVMNQPYQIVLLDTRMPDFNGLELVRRIHREHLPIAPLLPMLYTDDIRQQVEQYREHQLDSYLVKPITRRELFRAIARKLAEADGISPHVHLDKLPVESAPSGRGGRMRILVAEDSVDNCLVFEAYLRTEPCAVTFVRDGGQAVDKATANDYDLIFMDIQMPNTDGLTATRAIRKWERERGRKAIPIIALTASALDEDIEQSLQAGCNAHISKPVKKRVILDAIRDVARHQPSRGSIEAKENRFAFSQ